jgi:outer membrane protein assembly factor BamB
MGTPMAHCRIESGLRTVLFGLAALVASAAPALAQSRSELPTERELSRFGLVRAWWSQATLNPNSESVRYLSADEDNVYVQSSGGIVTAINAETGRRLWSALIGSAGEEGLPVASNEQQVLVAVGLHLFAIDKFTGKSLWNLDLPHHPSTSPEVDNVRVYIGMVDGSVYSYDLAKIKRLHDENRLPTWTNYAFVWRYQSPLEITSPPISTGQTVTFASRNGTVYSVASSERRLFFQFESDGTIQTPLGHGAGAIFVASEDARLFCLNEKNGVRRWGFTSGTPIRRQPRVIGGHVYFTPERDGMYCLNTDTGIIDPGKDGWHQPRATEFLAASNDHIYASDASGNVLILSRKDGALEGTLRLQFLPVRMGNERTDRLFFATSTGLITCLRERGQEFPLFHKYPERRPIMPELAPDEPAEEGGAVSSAN